MLYASGVFDDETNHTAYSKLLFNNNLCVMNINFR